MQHLFDLADFAILVSVLLGTASILAALLRFARA